MDEADPLHILMYVTQLYIWYDVWHFFVDAATNCEPQEKLKEMIDENVNEWRENRQDFTDWRLTNRFK